MNPEKRDTTGILWALFSLDGRLGKRAYFLGALLPFVAFVITILVFFRVTGDGNVDSADATGFEILLSFIVVGLLPLSLWAYVALTVKRLHDLNVSGFFIFAAAVAAIGFIGFVALCLLNGTDGPNRFGPAKNTRKTGY